jgi:hypothetical protein
VKAGWGGAQNIVHRLDANGVCVQCGEHESWLIDHGHSVEYVER